MPLHAKFSIPPVSLRRPHKTLPFNLPIAAMASLTALSLQKALSWVFTKSAFPKAFF